MLSGIFGVPQKIGGGLFNQNVGSKYRYFFKDSSRFFSHFASES